MTQTQEQQQNTGKKRILNGSVVSNAMQDTVVVAVVNHVPHRKYGKYLKQVKRYKAHAPNNTYEIGDTVSIEECAPISKDKRFKVVVE